MRLSGPARVGRRADEESRPGGRPSAFLDVGMPLISAAIHLRAQRAIGFEAAANGFRPRRSEAGGRLYNALITKARSSAISPSRKRQTSQ